MPTFLNGIERGLGILFRLSAQVNIYLCYKSWIEREWQGNVWTDRFTDRGGLQFYGRYCTTVLW